MSILELVKSMVSTFITDQVKEIPHLRSKNPAGDTKGYHPVQTATAKYSEWKLESERKLKREFQEFREKSVAKKIC